MKSLSLSVLFLSALMICGISQSQAQEEPAKKHKYVFKSIKKENGKEEVVEKEFETKEEMQEYMKSGGMDVLHFDDSQNPEMKDQKRIRVMTFKSSEDVNITDEKHFDIRVERAGDGQKIILNDKVIEVPMGEGSWTDEEGRKIIMLKDCEGKILENGNMVLFAKTIHIETISEKDKLPADIKAETEEEQLSVEKINVYPNPNNGKFNIKFDLQNKGDVTLKVIDMNTGEKVFEDHVKNFKGVYEKEVDLSGKDGNYVLQIFQNGKRITKKLVIG